MLTTGSVTVRARQLEGQGRGTARVLRTLTDRTWIAPLPIHAFALEHPEGLIVVDTGETSAAARPGYFPRWHPYYRFAVRLDVTPEQEIGPQLRAAGLDPADARWVVLTHLHTDHAGGLRHFPGSEIVVARDELAYASGRLGRLRGYPNRHWPGWLRPTTIDFADDGVGPFVRSHALTAAGDVRLLPTPGHTPGHLSVLVDGPRRVLIAGDASYTEELMRRGVVDGVAPDAAAARDTLGRLRQLVDQAPTAYLPAHDPGTAARAAGR